MKYAIVYDFVVLRDICHLELKIRENVCFSRLLTSKDDVVKQSFYYSVIFITDLSVIYAGRGFSDVLEESNSVFLSKGKKCGSAGEIFYGQFEYTGVSFGDLATAVCQEG